ncbi:FlaD/FlaE family flagellar protein [Halomontanus rarus]|uniref:FlaD/FlaE family flagellar protein n=1 Tax=Halomontanus rarus TaxID=3034020 RepID=UPI001A99F98B
MNLGLDNFRELLERFLSDTGGRRGRDREQAREERAQAGAAAGQGQEPMQGQGQAQGQPGDPANANADAGVPGEHATAQQGSTFQRQERPDPDEVDEDEVVDDLYHRIETLEDELESNGNQLGSIQDSQEHVADKVDDVDDTIRQLLGIYDQVTNDVNPFTGDGEEKGGFGVFGADDDDEGFGLGERREPEESESGDEDETVSFADLKGAIEDAAAAQTEERNRTEPTAQKITFDEEAYIGGETVESGLEGEGDGTRVEVQATEGADAARSAETETETENESDDDVEDEDADDVTLNTLANTFATDILVFEWLTELVRTGGPAATLRAISYYHEIGWIGRGVKEHLESVLSGPDLDIHVDPASTPDELTAEDHADSYTYIMKLNEIHATRQEVES